jgi:hypothetical protein
MTPVKPSVYELLYENPKALKDVLNTLDSRHYELDSNFINDLAKIFNNPVESLRYALSPHSPCSFLGRIYETMSDDQFVSDSISETTMNRDRKLYANDNLFNKTLLRYFSKTFKVFKNSFHIVLNGEIMKQLNKPLKQIEYYLNNSYIEGISEGKNIYHKDKSPLLPSELKSLDSILYVIYRKTVRTINTLSEMLKSNIDTNDKLEDILLTFSSVRILGDLLCRPKKTQSKDLVVSRLMSDLNDAAIKVSKVDYKPTKVPMSFSDIEMLVHDDFCFLHDKDFDPVDRMCRMHTYQFGDKASIQALNNFSISKEFGTLSRSYRHHVLYTRNTPFEQLPHSKFILAENNNLIANDLKSLLMKLRLSELDIRMNETIHDKKLYHKDLLIDCAITQSLDELITRQIS